MYDNRRDLWLDQTTQAVNHNLYRPSSFTNIYFNYLCHLVNPCIVLPKFTNYEGRMQKDLSNGIKKHDQSFIHVYSTTDMILCAVSEI